MRPVVAGSAAALISSLVLTTVATTPAPAEPSAAPGGRYHVKTPTSIGYQGAVSTVDPEASKAALKVLERGGNATDAAVAAAATLGVTEPYSAGIGGGGYFVHYDASTGKVETIDGRETAPMSMPNDAFIDPRTGEPYPFTPDLVTSGVSVGVPGTPKTWQRALQRWGSWSLKQSMRPAIRVAKRGFLVDQTFRDQTLDNKERFAAFTSTRELYLPGGDAPRVGSVFRNPELARTYQSMARDDLRSFYRGQLAREIASAAQDPPVARGTDLPVPPGYLEPSDLASYHVVNRAPTRSGYRGYDVYGMRGSSSGGVTVGEALNILERFDTANMSERGVLHRYLEASALAFADRAEYLGDEGFVDVPRTDLLSDRYARERACEINPRRALSKPVAAGDVTSYDGQCEDSSGREASDTENIDTTNLTVADRWGNVVEYTLTIEQTGGSGIVVPGRGFLLNNELTDFSTVWEADDPNRIEGGKRPRSSMSPTIVLKDGKPFLALGSPGGSTIITTVLQMLVNRVDLDMSVQEAIASPRASQRNTADVSAEPAFIDDWEGPLGGLGHSLVPAGDAFTSAAEIGAATAIEFGPRGLMTAVSEPTRRGGGSALVLRPRG